MGLDIYKYRVVKGCSDDVGFTLNNNEENKSVLALFEKFEEFSFIINVEYYSFSSAFNDIGLDICDYEWTMQDGKGYYFEHNVTREKVLLDYYTLEKYTYTEKEKALTVEEVAYQRKGVTDEFFDKFYGNCWYVSNNSFIEDGQKNIFIIDNEMLKKAQQYCEDDYPFKSWVLGDDEFVYFSA